MTYTVSSTRTCTALETGKRFGLMAVASKRRNRA
jgi:hypothetical protein